MDNLYPVILIIHLFCAIVFVGYLFCDVVFLSPIRKILGEEFADKMFSIIGRRSKWIPLCFMILFVTGLIMLSQYVGKEMGYFTTTLQQLLIIKSFLAFGIALMIIISLVFYYGLKKPSPLRRVIHPIALVLGVLIVVLAKLAFYI